MQRLGLRERLHEPKVIEAWSRIGEFIATHSTPVALREGILSGRSSATGLHHEPEQVSKIDVLQKSKTFRRQGDPRNSVASSVIYYGNVTGLLELFVALEAAGGFVL